MDAVDNDHNDYNDNVNDDYIWLVLDYYLEYRASCYRCCCLHMT